MTNYHTQTSVAGKQPMLATEGQKLRREAQTKLASEIEQLLTHTEQEGLRWKGTRIDLMEALHLAYETGLLQDESGISMKFTTLVRLACQLLHVSPPSNPYECASRGRRRKGMLMNSYLERYLLLLKRQCLHPIWESIDRS